MERDLQGDFLNSPFSPNDVLDMQRATEKNLQQRQRRFADYLAARGVLMPLERTDAFFGVLTARRQGQKQAAECKEQVDKCWAIPEPAFGTGGSSQNLEARRTRNRQISDCVAQLSVCGRVRRCGQPDNLPF
jgi:hypothetical protein